MVLIRSLILCVVLLQAGCLSSRWAMDDRDYAEKYGGPYKGDGFDKAERIAKQLVDARHVAQRTGVYAGGAVQTSPLAVGGEVGAMQYGEPWIAGQIGLAYLGHEHADVLFAGVNANVRIQPPSRLAPFVGVGLFGGYSASETVRMFREADQDDFLSPLPEPGTEKEEQGFAAVYPEIGVHYWLTGSTRLTGSAAYYFNSLGRRSDMWLIGLQVGFLLP